MNSKHDLKICCSRANKQLKTADDSGDSEFWDEAAYARAITPNANIRQSAGMEQMFAEQTPRDSEKRDYELNKRLSKFSEKRNERAKAQRGFFFRDKEAEAEDEEDESEVAKKSEQVF